MKLSVKASRPCSVAFLIIMFFLCAAPGSISGAIALDSGQIAANHALQKMQLAIQDQNMLHIVCTSSVDGTPYSILNVNYLRPTHINVEYSVGSKTLCIQAENVKAYSYVKGAPNIYSFSSLKPGGKLPDLLFSLLPMTYEVEKLMEGANPIPPALAVLSSVQYNETAHDVVLTYKPQTVSRSKFNSMLKLHNMKAAMDTTMVDQAWQVMKGMRYSLMIDTQTNLPIESRTTIPTYNNGVTSVVEMTETYEIVSGKLTNSDFKPFMPPPGAELVSPSYLGKLTTEWVENFVHTHEKMFNN